MREGRLQMVSVILMREGRLQRGETRLQKRYGGSPSPNGISEMREAYLKPAQQKEPVSKGTA